jgi:hypothetical protein
MSFEINQGQTARQVKYLTRGTGYSLFLTPGEAVLTLQRHTHRTRHHAPSSHETSAVVRIRLQGARPEPTITGESPLPGKVNYLIGNNPANWHAHIPTYAKVRYANVYKGIDLVYYGNQSQLEYDFVVAPGADPGRISFGFAGTRPRLSADGALNLTSSAGEICWHKPVVYQQVDGVRKPVAAHYAAVAGRSVGFALGRYDRSRPLIIDPVVSYSTFLAGTGTDDGRAIAIDNSGSAFVTGDTNSVDFPITPNAFMPDLPVLHVPTIFVTKLTPDGSGVVYSTYIGGTSSSYADSIAIDSAGHAFITGGTDCATFPTTPGCYQNSPQVPYGNNYFSELSADGSTLLYSTYLLGGNENGACIRVDSHGNVYAAGEAQNTNFKTTANAFQTTISGVDVFLIKFVPNGNTFTPVYSTFFGTSGDNDTDAIAVDNSGHVVMTGQTDSTTFPLKNAAQTTTTTSYHAFVAKFDTTQSGNASLVFSTYLGSPSPGSENSHVVDGGIGTDPSGNIYVAGETDSPSFPVTAGTYQTVYGGGATDVFVAKYSPSGKKLAATFLGGPSDESAYDVGVDKFGNVYVTGYTSASFPQVNSLQPAAVVTQEPGFIAILDTSLQHLLFSTIYGGSSSEFSYGIAVPQDGSAVYFTGTTTSNNFPTTANAFQKTAAGQHVFVVKIGFPIQLPAPQITDYTPGPELANGTTFTLTVIGKNFLNGSVVNWNGSPLATTYVLANTVKAVVPGALVASTGTAVISVTNPDSQVSNQVTLHIVNPVPTLSSISPATLDAGGPDVTITLSGNGYVAGSVVYWNQVPLTTTYLSLKKLTAVLPSAQTHGAAVSQVTVVNPTPGGGTSAAQSFTVNVTSVKWSQQSLKLNSVTNQYVAKIKLTNAGYRTMQTISVHASTLGGQSAINLPMAVADLAGGASTTITLTYPISAGPAGATVNLALTVTSSGGTFAYTHSEVLP